jgi:hypothetical protein
VIESLRRQVSLDDRDRDRRVAGSFISHTDKGEVVGGRRRREVVA